MRFSKVGFRQIPAFEYVPPHSPKVDVNLFNLHSAPFITALSRVTNRQGNNMDAETKHAISALLLIARAAEEAVNTGNNGPTGTLIAIHAAEMLKHAVDRLQYLPGDEAWTGIMRAEYLMQGLTHD